MHFPESLSSLTTEAASRKPNLSENAKLMLSSVEAHIQGMPLWDENQIHIKYKYKYKFK